VANVALLKLEYFGNVERLLLTVLKGTVKGISALHGKTVTKTAQPVHLLENNALDFIRQCGLFRL